VTCRRFGQDTSLIGLKCALMFDVSSGGPHKGSCLDQNIYGVTFFLLVTWSSLRGFINPLYALSSYGSRAAGFSRS